MPEDEQNKMITNTFKHRSQNHTHIHNRKVHEQPDSHIIVKRSDDDTTVHDTTVDADALIIVRLPGMQCLHAAPNSLPWISHRERPNKAPSIRVAPDVLRGHLHVGGPHIVEGSAACCKPDSSLTLLRTMCHQNCGLGDPALRLVQFLVAVAQSSERRDHDVGLHGWCGTGGGEVAG